MDARPITGAMRDTGLEVHHYEGQTYLVHGGEEPHWVWYDGELATCDCADFIWRERTCKHIASVHTEET